MPGGAARATVGGTSCGVAVDDVGVAVTAVGIAVTGVTRDEVVAV